MATIRKIFTYDDLEDKDIHDWLESLPQRQQSKYIRIALRTYLGYLREQENSNEPAVIAKRQSATQTHNSIKQENDQEPNKSKQVNEDKNDEDEYVSLDPSFIDDLGK